MTDKRTELGTAIEEGLREALAWKRGEIALEAVNVDPMPAERIRAIRKKVARSAKEFERRFGIPAATVSNWEQGRRSPDPAGRLLLKVLERHPEIVEAAAQVA
ncbi:helix-turn-helix domain-containing protein [Shinella pollutisoli]|uniref:Helix-turn-helix domain-containing protein n=1 Tax=Shinella pollutisoli TaxID=2250594 RepID=A0ABV7DD64_9HYPH|nr:type II toxin-antitoxin system MqsA family antitoxin [Shinella pollutisoli]